MRATNNEHPISQLSTKIVYENPWMRIREDVVARPDGSEGTYGMLEAGDAVVVTALNNHNQVYLVNQFIYSASAWSWLFPGGNSDGENLVQAAARELEEEAGITAREWVSLGRMRTANGITSHRVAYFLASNLSLGARSSADDSDVIVGGKFASFDEVDIMVENGEIDDCHTITGIHLAQLWLAHHVVTAASEEAETNL